MRQWFPQQFTTSLLMFNVQVLTECGPLEKGMANHFSILALRTHEQYEKAKRQDSERWTPQVGQCPICYWKSVENNSRKNEGMEPKQKQHPVWIWLVMEARSDAVKSNIALEPGMLGPWIKANWKWSNRRWQEQTSSF